MSMFDDYEYIKKLDETHIEQLEFSIGLQRQVLALSAVIDALTVILQDKLGIQKEEFNDIINSIQKSDSYKSAQATVDGYVEELNGMKESIRVISKYVNDESLTEEEKAYLDKYINV